MLMSLRSLMCHLKRNKMKIYFLFVLFFSSFNALSSSPVTKETTQAYNDMIPKKESSTDTIMPLGKNDFSTSERHAEVTDGKLAATPKSRENNENMADSYASFNGRNIIPYLNNAAHNLSEGLFNKEKSDGNTADAYNDVILKMKSSMYDYFSKMHNILKRVATEKHKMSGFMSPSNENKEYIVDTYVNSNIKNDHKHLDKAFDDLQENALNEVKNNVSTFEAYNNAIQEIESFMKDIMPKVDDYFSNMRHILKSQKDHNTDKSISTPDFMKEKEQEETAIIPNALKNNESLDNISIDQHEIGLSKMKVKENLIDVDGYSNIDNAAFKKQSPIKEKMIQTDILPLKMHHVLKRNVKKEDANLISASKPTEKKNNIFEASASSSVKNDDKKVSKATYHRSQKKINNWMTTEKSAVNQVNRDLKQNIQVELSNTIANAKVNSIESKSENKQAFSKAANKQSSDGKLFEVNFSHKDILNDKNKDILLKMNHIHRDSSKNNYNPNHVNKSILDKLNLHLIRQNKDIVETVNSENILEKKHPEELQTKTVYTNAKYMKQKDEENVNNAKPATASKVDSINQEESRRMTNKMFYSKENISKNYQKDLFSKTDPTIQTSTQIVDKNEAKIIKSEMSNSGNHVTNQ